MGRERVACDAGEPARQVLRADAGGASRPGRRVEELAGLRPDGRGDTANHLIRRRSHAFGQAVAEAVATGVPLDQLDLAAIDPAYGPDAKEVFSIERALESRTNPGAPSIQNVLSELERWRAALAES